MIHQKSLAGTDSIKRVGRKYGLISAAIGVLIAEVIMVVFTSGDRGILHEIFWFAFVDFKLNLAVGTAIMLLSGYYYGQIAAQMIVVRRKNALIAGLLCGIAVLLTTGLLSGWTGFFQEGIDNLGTDDDPFIDYIYKPLFWITTFGFLPAALVGVWFGMKVRRAARGGDTD